jgi:hypothetical protein
VKKTSLVLALAFACGCASTEQDRSRNLAIQPVASGVLLPVQGSLPPRLPELRIARTPDELGKVFVEHLDASQGGLTRKATKLGEGERALLVYAGRKPETDINVSAIRAAIDEQGTLVITIHEDYEPGAPRLEETHPFFLARMQLGATAPRRVKLRAVDGRPLKWDVWIDGEPR